MSSAIRKFSQIPVRTKYLLGFGVTSDASENDNAAVFGDAGASVIRVTNGAFLSIGAITTIADIALVGASIRPYLPSTSITGKLFKDLGRSVTVYDPTVYGDPHIAVYRECQLVNGAANEGVSENSPLYGADYYVRVWAADGTGVAVARTG
jgi:hypothetical protein